MPFGPKDLDAYLESFFAAVATSNPAVTDRSPGSGLYTLGRGFAALAAEQEMRLLELSESVHLRSSGQDLDLVAADYRVSRKAPRLARGHVLARSAAGQVRLGVNSIFVHPTNGLQFRLEVPTSVSNLGETSLPVIAMQTGPDSNLTAGTKLLSTAYPELILHVGRYRESTGEIREPLKGGEERESSDALRDRLRTTILQRKGGTEESIIAAALSFGGVVYAEVEGLAPGVVRLWLDANGQLGEASLQALQQALWPVRPVEIVLLLQQLERRYVSVRLELPAVSMLPLEELRQQALAETESYFRRLKRGQPFLPSDLTQSLRTTLRHTITVIAPEDPVNIPDNAVARLDSISVLLP